MGRLRAVPSAFAAEGNGSFWSEVRSTPAASDQGADSHRLGELGFREEYSGAPNPRPRPRLPRPQPHSTLQSVAFARDMPVFSFAASLATARFGANRVHQCWLEWLKCINCWIH